MLTVTILVVLGIGLLALASNKHFKLVGWLYENKKRHTRKVDGKKFIQNGLRISGWLLLVGSLIVAVNATPSLAISLVWWFSLISGAIFLVALSINK